MSEHFFGGIGLTIGAKFFDFRLHHFGHYMPSIVSEHNVYAHKARVLHDDHTFNKAV